jgi:hypothetical protein
MFGQIMSAIGGLSGVGSLLGPVLGYIGQEDTNDANVMLNRENRYWQEDMANTQYQRAVSDMRAAGLNPALMFKNAGPSVVPNVQPAQVQSEMGAAVSSAAQLSSAFATVEKIGAELGLIKAQEKNVQAQTVTEMAKPKNVEALTQLYGANTAKTIAETITETERPKLVRAQTGQSQSSAYANYAAGAASYEKAARDRVEADIGRQIYRNRNEFGQGFLGDQANSIDALVRRLFDSMGLVPPRR